MNVTMVAVVATWAMPHDVGALEADVLIIVRWSRFGFASESEARDVDAAARLRGSY
jgi:hypothetical protein